MVNPASSNIYHFIRSSEINGFFTQAQRTQCLETHIRHNILNKHYRESSFQYTDNIKNMAFSKGQLYILPENCSSISTYNLSSLREGEKLRPYTPLAKILPSDLGYVIGINDGFFDVWKDGEYVFGVRGVKYILDFVMLFGDQIFGFESDTNLLTSWDYIAKKPGIVIESDFFTGFKDDNEFFFNCGNQHIVIARPKKRDEQIFIYDLRLKKETIINARDENEESNRFEISSMHLNKNTLYYGLISNCCELFKLYSIDLYSKEKILVHQYRLEDTLSTYYTNSIIHTSDSQIIYQINEHLSFENYCKFFHVCPQTSQRKELASFNNTQRQSFINHGILFVHSSEEHKINLFNIDQHSLIETIEANFFEVFFYEGKLYLFDDNTKTCHIRDYT